MTTFDEIYSAIDLNDQKLAQINADRRLLRLAVDGLVGMISKEYVDGLYALVDAIDNDVDAALAEQIYLHRLAVEFRDAAKTAALKVLKQKGKTCAAAKKRKTRSK